MAPAQSTHLQLIAALAAMSEANLALRTGSLAAPAICRAARCLDVLADCPDLTPALRRLCDAMSSQWAATIGTPPGDGRVSVAGRAPIIPFPRQR